MRALTIVSISTTLCLAGCGGGTGDDGGGGGGGSGGTLSGTIDGTAWTLNAAYSESFGSSATEKNVILLGGSDTGSCAAPNQSIDAPKLQLRVPTAKGTYDVSAAENRELNVVIPPSDSFNIGSGTVEVLEEAGTTVRASLEIADGRATLSGTFVAEICE